jgi:Mg2+ and Co2+ transporter CorA
MDVRVATGIDLRFISGDGVEDHPVQELRALLNRDDGLVWVDIPVCEEAAARVLSEVFGFHPLAIRDCVERNAVPKVRAYRDQMFVVLHAPELGTGGHVHYVELRRLLTRLVWHLTPDPAFTLGWSVWRRRHQATARRAHYQRQRTKLRL